MIVGMDFGTTNSGMAVYDGRELRRLPLDPSNDNPQIARTALYVTNEQDVTVGREAVDRYFAHNVGRPVKLQKVWVGEIEVIADLVYFVQDAYVWTDVMSPGRLFLSFKSNLRDPEYTGTVIGQFFYPLETLVALYLYVMKRRAEEILGQELRQVTLGRPVHFADDPEHDNLAQERLLRGAFQAGYEKVYLQREPIAAAHHYASKADRPENVLVFDFGGGTLDITIMRLGDGVHRVLATGGVPIAGDVFDRKLVRARLPKHFGEGGKYGAREMPIPTWIYDTFSNWQTILELQTPENKRILQQIEKTAQRPREIRGLNSLVSGNYGLKMFDAVEQTKRDLSERFGGMIRLEGPEFDVMELVTRREFETIIRAESRRIERELEETVQAAGLKPKQIEAVIRTGGSAEIPLFRQMLRRKFGPDRVHSMDTFGSVTAGLGIMAQGIETGQIEARAYTRSDLKRQEVTVSRPNVSIAELALLKRRIRLREKAEDGASADPEPALVLLTQKGRVLVDALDGGPRLPGDEALSAQRGAALLAAFTAHLDEPLLLITSHYKFLLTTARQILDLQELGHSLARLHHFGPRETVRAISRWQAVKDRERLLLVTSVGYVRAYPVDVMATSIEAPMPLTFEQPLPGWPTAALGAPDAHQLILITSGGRGLRYAVREVPGSGLHLLKRTGDDEVVAAFVARDEDELLLVTDRGYGRRMPVSGVHAANKGRSRGRVLISRRPVRGAGAVPADHPLWLATTAGVSAVRPGAIPCEPDSTRSHRLFKPAQGQEVLQLVVTHGPRGREALDGLPDR